MVPEELQPPMALDIFLEKMGITPTTAWRWRKDGKLETINICGRLYVTAKAILNFNRRAAAGEFEKVHKTPSRPGLAKSKGKR